MVCLQNGMTKYHFIKSEPIYQNRSPAKYSFFSKNLSPILLHLAKPNLPFTKISFNIYKSNAKCLEYAYHRITALPQVKPLPKAAITSKSPSFTLPCSIASVKAIGIDAAVVLPYFCILLNI